MVKLSYTMMKYAMMVLMPRVVGYCLFALASMCLIQSCTRKSTSSLVIWTFPGYFDEGLQKRFEQATGIHTEVRGIGEIFDGLNKLRAGEQVDVLMSDPALMDDFRRYELVLALDQSRLRSWSDLWPEFQELKTLSAGTGKVWGVPYTFGATGLAIRTDAVQPGAATSWNLLWKPDIKGKVSINGRLRGLLVVLLAMGEDWDTFINEHLPRKDEVYRKVLQRAIELRKNALKQWVTGSDVQELLRSGQIVATDSWDGPARQLADAGVPVQFSLPLEGGVGWCDLWVVSAKSRNVDAAYQFLNFVDSDEAIRTTVERSGYNRCNRAGMERLPEALKKRVMYTDAERRRIRQVSPVKPELQKAVNEIVEDIQLGR